MTKRVLTILVVGMAVLGHSQEGRRIETQGEVVCAKTTILSFSKNGIVSFVAPFGALVKSPLVNSEGKIIKQGDLLASLDTAYYQMQLKEAELKLDITRTSYNESKTEYERNLLLAKKM